jgi:hypothetical protein
VESDRKQQQVPAMRARKNEQQKQSKTTRTWLNNTSTDTFFAARVFRTLAPLRQGEVSRGRQQIQAQQVRTDIDNSRFAKAPALSKIGRVF